ncbi:cysteine desulfurase / selenocysteine lyase [Sporobacter termitidis DSM 10068]|uniref:cysteine desulfurase n=1 Tax=Sporobacter termitidis DSM 10068 TaxID=1123282 RepID=A0A1M5WIX7_9FIRM|nr:cysteine desulfurase [Sporobacter termitidis]SHH87455.1 cysteine desulfurase / selenocysteine lyase [Sporobacter termitidis DSM 10068]
MNKYLHDFPLLLQPDEKGRRIAYLDNAATTQKPQAVLDAVTAYYQTSNANPHRGAYDLSEAATKALESAREKVRAFLGAPKAAEIVFTKSATESLNLVAQSYGMSFLNPGDEIVLAISEHHSNLVPWQIVARARGAFLTYLYTDESGRILPGEIEKKITGKTKLVAAAHASNVTGVVNPIEAIIDRAHQVGAVAVVDGTQSAPHMAVDVAALGADFYALSAHKMLGPMGVGVLYGKEKLLEAMPPFLYGGDMIEYVEEQTSTFAPVPQKFEGGTQNVGGAVGLSAAIDYLNSVGMESIREHERALTAYMLDRLRGVPQLKIVGPDELQDRIGVVSFTLEGAHPHDVATILNADRIAVRSGHHCAHPFMCHLGVQATCRASVYLYNSNEDIDRLAESLKGVRRWLGYGLE